MVGLKRFYDKECNPRLLSPLALAFVGDGVFDLLVRERLVCESGYQVGILNKMKVDIVCCKSQAQSIKKLLPLLSQEEIEIYKRGRNAHCAHTPKNASKADYHEATGLECLIGYIYLKGDTNRLMEIFQLIIEE